MVAPVKVKWRRHCSTCGVTFDEPQKWAYCSKDCERARRGNDAEIAGEDQWLTAIYKRRLDLRQQMETAMPWERAGLLARIADTEREETTMRESVAGKEAARTSVEFWAPLVGREADRFETSLRRSLGFAIRLGRRLCEAKAALDHGEFGRLFADHPNPVIGALTFSSSWARKLMAIGGNPAISNRAHAHVLPPDVQLVYTLSRLPADTLEAAIERGDITPTMRRADAQRLLPATPEVDVAEAAEEVFDDELAKVLDPVRVHLARFVADKPAQFPELRTRLRAILRSLERAARGEVRS